MWNPIDAIKKKYPDMGLSDAEIYQRLSDPAKFRSAFPEYSNLSDEDIKTNMQKIGLSRPDLQAPPTIASSKVEMHGEKFNPAEAIAYAVTNPSRGVEALGKGMEQTSNELADTSQDGALEAGMKHAGSVSLGAIKAIPRGAIDLDNLARKGLNKVGGEYDLIDTPDVLQNKNGYETTGGVLENIAEFMFGEGELKALSQSQKLAKLSKVAKVMEEFPVLGKLLKSPIVREAALQGTVGAGQQFVHSQGDVGDSLETGAITGALGAGGALLGKGIGSLAGRLGKMATKAEEVGAADASQAIRTAATETGASSATQPASVRSVLEDVSDNVFSKAKSLFGKIDEATNNQLSPVQNELRDIGFRMRNADEATMGELLKRRAELEAKQEVLFQLAKKNGVEPKVIDEGRAAWKQASAMGDVDHAVKASTKGMRPELATEGATPETIDPKQLFNRLNKLYDSGRLQEAFGDTPQAKSSIQNLFKTLDLAQQKSKGTVFSSVMSSLAKHSVLRAGVGAVIGGGVGYKEGGVAGLETGVGTGAVIAVLMKNPTALTLMRRGLETGQPATKITAAVVNAIQVQNGKK